MGLGFLPEALSLFPLGLALVLGWKERKHFHSLTPFVVAVGLFLIGRGADTIIQAQSSSFALPSSLTKKLDLISERTDTTGVFLLVLGFVKTINFQREEERRISELSSLLPICAWCKKIRAEDGSWKSLEAFLVEESHQNLTHGICPNCRENVRQQSLEETLGA